MDRRLSAGALRGGASLARERHHHERPLHRAGARRVRRSGPEDHAPGPRGPDRGRRGGPRRRRRRGRSASASAAPRARPTARRRTTPSRCRARPEPATGLGAGPAPRRIHGIWQLQRRGARVISEAYERTPREEVFQQTACHPLMSPKDVRVRESRDSADIRVARIVFALDVTGSMGDIPESSPGGAAEVHEGARRLRGADPQLLFMAVGDANSDEGAAPGRAVRVDRRADASLAHLEFMEGKGGGGTRVVRARPLLPGPAHRPGLLGQAAEARLHVHDRRRAPYPAVSRTRSRRSSATTRRGRPRRGVVAAVQRRSTPSSYPGREAPRRCERTWRELLGDHVIAMEGPEDTCYVAAGLVALTERVVPDLDGIARVVEAAGAPERRVWARSGRSRPTRRRLARTERPRRGPSRQRRRPGRRCGGSSAALIGRPRDEAARALVVTWASATRARGS